MKHAALAALLSLLAVSPLAGEGAIFPTALHLTREISDPISGKTVVLEEYAYGNRLVSVRDHVTAIADYEKGELTEIDRRAATYSITKFETIAKATRLQGGASSQHTAAGRTLQSLGARPTKSGRQADFFRANGEAQSIEIALDRDLRVSREALEVLLGTAYPATRAAHHDLVIDAARGGREGGRGIATNAAAADYALPLEQILEIDTGGAEPIHFRSTITSVGSEPPPAEVLAIPAGARLIESRTAGLVRELELLDKR